jgi:hypothetical protein
MVSKIDVEELDNKMQKNGWKFLGVILHYDKAWKKQASIYEKNGKYIVSGIDSSGEGELYEPIPKKEAEKRIEEGIKEIRKYMFGELK